MKNINLEPVKETVKFVCKVATYVATVGLVTKLGEYITTNDYASSTTYSDAVKAITNSSMFSGDKTKILETLPSYKPSEFYKAVIIIAEDYSLYSGDKVKTIQHLCETK